ncbi:MAG: metallophosphoesterase [Candidatus Latescibacteria bacterium]|nr:metallophosphoesterase [Candidatus Latescibacterota bacterium]
MQKGNIVGIISDSHDDREMIHKAVATFNDAGCSLVIHAGDFVAPFTIREFEKLNSKFIGVFGNNDGEIKGLTAQFSKIGSLHKPPYEFGYNGKRFLVMHEPDYLDKNKDRDDLDVIIYGHLHEIDIRPGKPMIINPGESCSWLTGRPTVVLLDLLSMGTELIDLR